VSEPSQPDPRTLYGAAIRAHGASPEGAVLHPGAPFVERLNELCGDRVRTTVKTEGERIVEIACETRGCILCIASGSMMVAAVRGSRVEDALTLAQRLQAVICAKDDGPALPEPLSDLTPARHFTERRRCVTLPWEALDEVLAAAEQSP
jgi:nitrogen fixation NifU-like protein